MWNPLLKKRGLEEVERRLHSSQTFTQPLRPTPTTKEKMKIFITKFYKEVYTPAKKEYYKQTLDDNSETLKLHYDILVPKIVAYEDFWQRYEYRCNLHIVMEELAEADGGVLYQLSGSVSNLTNSFNTSIRNLSIVGNNGGDGLASPASSSQPATPAASGHGSRHRIKNDDDDDEQQLLELAKKRLSSRAAAVDVVKQTEDNDDGNDSDATAGTDEDDDEEDDENDIEKEDDDDEEELLEAVEDAKNVADASSSSIQEEMVETTASVSEEQQ